MAHRNSATNSCGSPRSNSPGRTQCRCGYLARRVYQYSLPDVVLSVLGLSSWAATIAADGPRRPEQGPLRGRQPPFDGGTHAGTIPSQPACTHRAGGRSLAEPCGVASGLRGLPETVDTAAQLARDLKLAEALVVQSTIRGVR